jgi:hypothetical protein
LAEIRWGLSFLNIWQTGEIFEYFLMHKERQIRVLLGPGSHFPPILVCRQNNQYHLDGFIFLFLFLTFITDWGEGEPLVRVRAPAWDGHLTELEWQPIRD